MRKPVASASEPMSAAQPPSERAKPRARRTEAMPRLFLSCEHGGNLVPEDLAPLFVGQRRLLDSHRGWDPGALELAVRLAAALQAPLRFALVSRLVVDLNRSVGHPALFAQHIAALPRRDLALILARHYQPYRRETETAIARLARRRPVIHLSLHTFTPVLKGRKRTVDIGLLFDPSREFELRTVAGMERRLRAKLPDLRIRRNAPYRGTDDGFTTYLRTRLADQAYAGIELEVNQRFPRAGGPRWRAIQESIAAALATPERQAR